MSERTLNVMDIREILIHLRARSSNRQVQRDTGLDRRTVQRYRKWAEEQGLLAGEMPSLEELLEKVEHSFEEKVPPQNASSVESYRGLIEGWEKAGVEVAAMRQRLMERGYTGSYAAVWRFVQQIRKAKPPEVVVRVETKAGEEAQVDFGYAGRMIDPQSGELRKAWAFVMVLSWSRHQYVEFVWDQKVETFLACHSHAFEFFGGVPGRVRIDYVPRHIIDLMCPP